MPLIKECLALGKTVRLSPKGTSMMPMIRQGVDTVILAPLTGKLKKYDLPIYQRKNGQYVLHRIYQKRSDGYYLMGDHQLDPEGPIEEDAIFAIVTEVERNGRWISADAFFWKAACGLWRMLYPVRRFFCGAKFLL